jgi:hypothetical protein
MNVPALVGDHIENPWNALTMVHAADMLGGTCWFRDAGQLAQDWRTALPSAPGLPVISMEQLKECCALWVAFDNSPRAADVYGFRLPKEPPAALVVGNERRGLSHEFRAAARYSLQIPMVSRSINCLNVAAASAVGLYYLSRRDGHKLQTANHPHKNRPDLLLAGAGDHIELGSAIRSACAFGWERALVEDRANIWFGCDRVTRSEGRGAARRGRNPIRLLPSSPATHYAYQEVMVITSRHPGIPLPHAKLAQGPQGIVVIPDESRLDVAQEDWQRLGRNVQFINLDLPATEFVYHYRLIATVAMAEIARQVGRKPRRVEFERKEPRLIYRQAIRATLEARGELVYLEELEDY